MENQKAITKLIHELNKLDKTIHLSEGLNEVEVEFNGIEYFILVSISVALTYDRGDSLTPPTTEIDEVEGWIEENMVSYIDNEDNSIEIHLTAEQEQQITNLLINKSQLF